jgi:transcriptional regulator with XRE-family HTH domain
MTSPKPPHPPDLETLGRALAALRQSAGLTQVEAAELVGIRSQFVSEVENGRRGMRWATLLKLLGAYGANLHDLGEALDRAGAER